MDNPGPGNGCLSIIVLGSPSSFPKFLTSSLNNSFSGSTNFRFRRLGSPPTL